MKVTIDKSICKGHQRCYNLYPNLFKSDAEGKGLVTTDVPLLSEDDEVDAQSAANSCPVGAIQIEY